MTRHLLSIADMTTEQVNDLLQLATRMKATPRAPEFAQALTGKTLGLLFEKPSTRTRISFEVGMNQLGGSALMIRPEDSQLGRGESIPDTARTLSRFLDGFMIRTFAHEVLLQWADNGSIPVINGLTDEDHPCQALADLLTLQERFGALDQVTFAYVGDGNNMTHSLMLAAAKVGMAMRVATPHGYNPDPDIIARAQTEAAANGTSLTLTDDPVIAVKGANAVYTDVWASMGQEDSHTERLTAFHGYQIDDDLMNQAAPEAIFMHCLPAHRGEEVSASVMDGPRSIVFDQAENRLHIQKAILYRLLSDQA